jgi:hypothetical protein
MTGDEIIKERDRLMEAFMAKGGRDIYLAERIDELNCVLGECICENCGLSDGVVGL